MSCHTLNPHILNDFEQGALICAISPLITISENGTTKHFGNREQSWGLNNDITF